MEFQHVTTGVCGRSCELCPRYHTEGSSRCGGCKSPFRMGAGCPFVTCAVKKKGIELCADCAESGPCGRWNGIRDISRDSFVTYQKLWANNLLLKSRGITALEEDAARRNRLLEAMLAGYDDGRSKSFYCIAATILEIPELERALTEAGSVSAGMAGKEKARAMRRVLEGIAKEKGYYLALRK